MTIKNPEIVKKAKYLIDERNVVCLDCAVRLTGEGVAMLEEYDKDRDCTECVAFKAGFHPETAHGRRTTSEIEAKLAELQAVKAQDVDYVAGILDGACSTLGWFLGKTETLEWNGR